MSVGPSDYGDLWWLRDWTGKGAVLKFEELGVGSRGRIRVWSLEGSVMVIFVEG